MKLLFSMDVDSIDRNDPLIEDREFNELVNMSSSELEDWLKEEQSEGSGWAKDDGSGETVGHERCVAIHYVDAICLQSKDAIVLLREAADFKTVQWPQDY